MSFFSNIFREIKNLFEFYIIPLLVVILPHKVSFYIYKLICRYTFFYNKYSNGSLHNAEKFLNRKFAKALWIRNVKLLFLYDIADYWLATLRPNKMKKLNIFKGEWANNNNLLLLGLHYGPGYVMLMDLKEKKYSPHFVFVVPEVSYKYQSFIEDKYRKARVKHLNNISGGSTITTGGGYQLILDTVANKGTPIILYDAPKYETKTKYCLQVFGKKYPVASGFINLICKEGIDFQLYNVQLDFETGMRKITISDLKSYDSEEKLLEELSSYFEKVIQSSPEQWFFWRQSSALFQELDNEK